MNILVTGANGQLGEEIRILSEKFPNYNFIFTDIQELDLSDSTIVDSFCKDEKLDYLVNCAAYTAVDVAESDEYLAALINTKVPEHLGKISKTLGFKVIHVSTDYVFDGTSSTPYVEDDMVNPESVYGKTKLNGEISLLRENPDAIVIRTAWLYSAYGKNFVKTMIKLGEERDNMKVVYDQIGTPTYAGDLAKTILEIISKTEKKEVEWIPGIFHYSNEGVCSWYDFAKAIHEFCSISCDIWPVSTDEYPTPAKRPAYSVLNKSRIKKTFNFEIPYWRDSLKVCIDVLNK